MKIAIVTIVLDGMKFLPAQFYTFNSLYGIDWTWYIAEGRADNIHCTSWCKKLPPRLSKDGTTAYLNNLRSHPRIKVWQQQLWPGKVSMYNAMLETIKEPCALLQVDVDEFWRAEQIVKIATMFDRSEQLRWMRFDCVYHLGPNIISIGDDVYGHRGGEWLRAFRFRPGNKFVKHEPPVLEGVDDLYEPFGLSREETRRLNLVFSHYPYVYPEQVMEKEEYYGYKDALQSWYRLQRNTQWPVKRLEAFLPWVGKGAQADLLYK